MNKFKPGDKVSCHLNNGKFVLPESGFEEIKDFEIVAVGDNGYFFYVPDYYNLPGTIIITSYKIKAHNIDKRFINFSMIYVEAEYIAEVHTILDGLICYSCNEFYKFAEANEEGGRLKCWSCRSYKRWN